MTLQPHEDLQNMIVVLPRISSGEGVLSEELIFIQKYQ